jgi:hypothetical protein
VSAMEKYTNTIVPHGFPEITSDKVTVLAPNTPTLATPAVAWTVTVMATGLFCAGFAIGQAIGG